MRNPQSAIPLLVPAGIFFLQFVLIGAGKPAEYGRFGIFTNTALAIAAACLLVRPWTRLRAVVNWIPASMVVIWVGVMGWYYVANFALDASGWGTRQSLGWAIHEGRQASIPLEYCVVPAEPAPYCCPPIDFRKSQVWFVSSFGQAAATTVGEGYGLAVSTYDAESGVPETIRSAPVAYVTTGEACDDSPLTRSARVVTWVRRLPRGWLSLRETPISWANKPVALFGLVDRQTTHYIP